MYIYIYIRSIYYSILYSIDSIDTNEATNGWSFSSYPHCFWKRMATADRRHDVKTGLVKTLRVIEKKIAMENISKYLLKT